jgi:hypothetical protein
VSAGSRVESGVRPVLPTVRNAVHNSLTGHATVPNRVYVVAFGFVAFLVSSVIEPGESECAGPLEIKRHCIHRKEIIIKCHTEMCKEYEKCEFLQIT